MDLFILTPQIMGNKAIKTLKETITEINIFSYLLKYKNNEGYKRNSYQNK